MEIFLSDNANVSLIINTARSADTQKVVRYLVHTLQCYTREYREMIRT